MNIHEYQAKELLRLYKLPIPKGFAFQKKQEKISYINKLKGPPWVVKSQIHAGGRGSGYFLGFKKMFSRSAAARSSAFSRCCSAACCCCAIAAVAAYAPAPPPPPPWTGPPIITTAAALGAAGASSSLPAA